jgi:succinate dehydrogenase/fumarate reductase cytochrome b subunit
MGAAPERPVPRATQGWEVSVFEGLIGLLILIADVWAILNIFQSSESTGTKALWIVLVLVLPLLGFVIWYFAGPKSSTG